MALVTATFCSRFASTVIVTTSWSARTRAWPRFTSSCSTASFISDSCCTIFWVYSRSFWRATSRSRTGPAIACGGLMRVMSAWMISMPSGSHSVAHRALEVLLELDARVTADEVATRLVRALDAAEAARVRQDDLVDDLVRDRVVVAHVVVSDEDLGRAFGLHPELDDAVQADPESVLRGEAHVLVLGEV